MSAGTARGGPGPPPVVTSGQALVGQRGHDDPPGVLTVRSCLRIPLLSAARLVAGGAGQDTREVRWMTVIEGPVEDFVSPGDFVLTTGLGHGAERLHELTAEVGAAGASALVVAVGDDAPVTTVPADARAVADALELPLFELAWEIRFADVLRALTDRLLSARYAATLDAGEQLPAGFADALLAREGLDAIAEACEALIDRPVLILDPGLAVISHGPLAAARLGRDALAAQPDVARALTPAALADVCEPASVDEVQWCPAVPEAGLPAGLRATAVAQGTRLGYVLAADDAERRDPLIVERHALAHAAVAVAIEMLRRRAVAEAEARARGGFLWDLAGGAAASESDLATKAALLGYSVNRPYRVALAEAGPGGEAELDEVVHYLRHQGAASGLHASRRSNRVLVLVPPDAPAPLHPARLAARAAERLGAAACTWGIAAGEFMLLEVADGLRQAERALRVGRALSGEGTVADADALGPFLMLDAIATDEATQRMARATLAPLEEYDRTTARGLVETLETFLQENCNTTKAARALFLNRHSLMYRLRKIEALTGRSLDSHDDRFILELSVRLRRMLAG